MNLFSPSKKKSQNLAAKRAMQNEVIRRLSPLAPLLGLALLFVCAFAYFFFLLTLPAPRLFNTTRLLTQGTGDPLVTGVRRQAAPTIPTVTDEDYTYGDKNSALTIVLFSDFGCPFCKTMSSDLKRLIATHPEAHLVWKDFPLTAIHPMSKEAHIAARCAGAQGEFWAYHDRLFAIQEKFSRGTFLTIANDLALKPANFQSCLDNPETESRIETNIAEGNALGIDGTPYLFVGDQRVSGALSYDELKRTIEINTLIKQKK